MEEKNAKLDIFEFVYFIYYLYKIKYLMLFYCTAKFLLFD